MPPRRSLLANHGYSNLCCVNCDIRPLLGQFLYFTNSCRPHGYQRHCQHHAPMALQLSPVAASIIASCGLITSTSCSTITSNVINNWYTNGVVPNTLSTPRHPTMYISLSHTPHTLLGALSLRRYSYTHARTRTHVRAHAYQPYV